jgi:tetratricopeptide (TPR) repeat protein
MVCSLLVALLWFALHPLPSHAQQADADVLVAQAVLAYDDQRYDAALELLKRALALDPGNARGLYYGGLTYLALQKPDQAVAPLETLRSLRPKDRMAQYQLGVAYFSIGDYDKASPLLEEVFRQQPELENLGYYVGFMRYRQKAYNEAAEAFRIGKTSDPNVQQLTQFYRGLSFGVLGLSEQAQAELRAAQQMQAVSPITGAAVRMQEALRAAPRLGEAKRLRAQMAVGGYYDDNVAINPNPSQDPIAETFRSRKTTSSGELVSVSADYSFYRDGPLEATVTYSFLQTANFNHGLHTFNLRNHLGGMGGFYRGVVADVPYQIGLQYTYDYLSLDQAGFLSRHTPTLSETFVPPTTTLPVVGTVGHLTTLLQRYQQKYFRQSADNDIRFASEVRDAHNGMVGLLHVFRFAQDDVLVRLGYQFDVENAKGSAFSYTGNRLQTGGQVKLPWGEVSMRYDYEVHRRAYKNPQTLFADDEGRLSRRHDVEQTHMVQVLKPLTKNFTLVAQYQRVRSDSNVPVYDYTKNVYTMLVAWSD